MDIKMVSHVVIVKRLASRGVSTSFLEPWWPKNRVTVAKADREPFCDFLQLWYNPFYEFSALQGWRHGVHSRSLGGTPVSSTREEPGTFDRGTPARNSRVSSRCRSSL